MSHATCSAQASSTFNALFCCNLQTACNTCTCLCTANMQVNSKPPRPLRFEASEECSFTATQLLCIRLTAQLLAQNQQLCFLQKLSLTPGHNYYCAKITLNKCKIWAASWHSYCCCMQTARPCSQLFCKKKHASQSNGNSL
jgi:hypothetical protein